MLLPVCAEKANGTQSYNGDPEDSVILIATMTVFGVLAFIALVVVALIVAYSCWKRRMKVQEINSTKNNNLQSWVHCHDDGHQQPSADVSYQQ